MNVRRNGPATKAASKARGNQHEEAHKKCTSHKPTVMRCGTYPLTPLFAFSLTWTPAA